VRQTGGRGQYGDVYIEVDPNEPGGGFVFENKIVGGAVPREYVPAVEKGIKEAMESGVLAGYPMVAVKVALTGGSYHAVDATEMRSMTEGRATYTMQFARYEEVPAAIAEEIMAKVAGKPAARAGSR